MIKDFLRLRQLDLKEVTRSEKQDVGLDVSDESEEDDEAEVTRGDKHSKTGLFKVVFISPMKLEGIQHCSCLYVICIYIY